jgi:uncharacterized membrane protein
MDITLTDVGSFLISLSLFTAYHLYVRWRLRNEPLHTVHAVNRLSRRQWVNTVMKSGKMDVLAVQTLRNSVMASSFMASTAILLIIGVLTLANSADRGSSVWHALNVAGTTEDTLLAWKLLLLLSDFFIAFFSFSMAVRFFNHVGYMINIPAELGIAALSPLQVAAFLNRAGNFYSYGTRAFYYCVPLVFWIFGPQFMVIATVVLIPCLYVFDTAPRAHEA